jgi:CheY-like chemotaxis protein
MSHDPGPEAPPAGGLSVLVVEDELPVAQALEDMLRDIGHTVIARARTVAEALKALASRRPDAVLLDVNLAGEPAYRVADFLKEKEIPFVVATAYAPPSLPTSFDSALILRKPFDRADLKRGLEIVVARRA